MECGAELGIISGLNAQLGTEAWDLNTLSWLLGPCTVDTMEQVECPRQERCQRRWSTVESPDDVFVYSVQLKAICFFSELIRLELPLRIVGGAN